LRHGANQHNVVCDAEPACTTSTRGQVNLTRNNNAIEPNQR
jgi:hypothetical protein